MPEKHIDEIDRLMQQRPMYKEVLSVYRDLLGFVDEIEPEVAYKAKDASIRELKAREGFPLFSRGDLPIDHEAAAVLFQRLLGHLSSTERKDREALKRALKAVEGNPKWVNDVIGAFLSGDEVKLTAVAQDLTLSPMVVKFLAHMAVWPSMKYLRESAAEGIQERTWNHGWCPLCGSSPDMAYFNDEGRRFLHCELCGYEWTYPRLKCPFCENERAKDLGYFTGEEEEGYRVDFCKRCKRYIKTLDRRLVGSPGPLELENLTTLHLDMLAHKQGFTPSGG